jgi:hypothetical protein
MRSVSVIYTKLSYIKFILCHILLYLVESLGTFISFRQISSLEWTQRQFKVLTCKFKVYFQIIL